MPLQFPTMAEQALVEFRNATSTVSLAVLARRFGADVERQWPAVTIYTFDDDTALIVTGRGKSHKVVAELP